MILQHLLPDALFSRPDDRRLDQKGKPNPASHIDRSGDYRVKTLKMSFYDQIRETEDMGLAGVAALNQLMTNIGDLETPSFGSKQSGLLYNTEWKADILRVNAFTHPIKKLSCKIVKIVTGNTPIIVTNCFQYLLRWQLSLATLAWDRLPTNARFAWKGCIICKAWFFQDRSTRLLVEF